MGTDSQRRVRFCAASGCVGVVECVLALRFLVGVARVDVSRKARWSSSSLAVATSWRGRVWTCGRDREVDRAHKRLSIRRAVLRASISRTTSATNEERDAAWAPTQPASQRRRRRPLGLSGPVDLCHGCGGRLRVHCISLHITKRGYVGYKVFDRSI